tara:strand:+ start:1734 stop:2207 length:474 start_codon:yes stop_codon:yes gene_type:complete
MLEKLKAIVKVKCPEADNKDETRGAIFIDAEEKVKFTLENGESKSIEIEFDVKDVRKVEHELAVHHLYTPNPLSALIIETIILDDIDLGVILYKGEYKPVYPEPWYSDEVDAGRPPKEIIGDPESGKDGNAPLFMGWEGVYTLKFTTPLYEWLLEHL